MNDEINQALEIVATGFVVVMITIVTIFSFPLWGPVYIWLKIKKRKKS